MKRKNEGEDSSDDDITLSRLKSKKRKKQRILESDEEDEFKHTKKHLTRKKASNFQKKDEINLDVHGINLRDHTLTDNMCLDDNGEILTDTVAVSMPEFLFKFENGIKYKKQYQQRRENMEQFKFVQTIATSTDNEPSFLKWSEVLELEWDSPELFQAALVSDRFMFGHWPSLIKLSEKFRNRLKVFLKSIFSDQLEHDHIDEILDEKEYYGLLISGYEIDAEDMDIFSCLIYQYIDNENKGSPTGIVYIASSPLYRGLGLGSLMLCILSQLLLFQDRSNTLFISTAPNNQQWYESHQFIEVNSENKFEDEEESTVVKNFSKEIFRYCVNHKYLDADTGLQYDENGKECEFLSFMIHEETFVNDKYFVTKRLFDLSRSIHFQPVKNPYSEAFGLSNKIIDKVVDALSNATTFTVDSSDKIRLYEDGFKKINKITHAMTILLRRSGNKLEEKEEVFRQAIIDPFVEIRQFMKSKVVLPMNYFTHNWNSILCSLPMAYLPRKLIYRCWMSVLSKLNAVEIRLVSVNENMYGLFCSCCNAYITTQQGFSPSISKLINLMRIAVDVHYCTYCEITENRKDPDNDDSNSSDRMFHTPTCFDPKMATKLAADLKAEGIRYTQCGVLGSSKDEMSKKALELINALKFDKLTYPSVARIRSMWIDAFFGALTRKRNVDAVENYLKNLKTSFVEEFRTIIQQLEKDSFSFTGDILESLYIKHNRSANKTGPMQMVGKLVYQVLQEHGINFDKMIPLPPTLSYQKDRIKSLVLFCTFNKKIDNQRWSELPSKSEFKNSLQVSQWSSSQKRKTFKGSLLFRDKSDYKITISLPHSRDAFGSCPVPFVHPVSYSKYIDQEELPDASGWDDDDAVMNLCGANWCKNAPDLHVSNALQKQIDAKKKELGFDEIHDSDPYQQEMVLRNMHKIRIFGRKGKLSDDCRRKTIYNLDSLWKDNVRVYGKCAFSKDFIDSHELIWKYLTKYTEPFEVMDCVVKQLPLGLIETKQNKGWIDIPNSVRSKINEIADKIKGSTIRTIMPCIIGKPSAHLLSVHGNNKKSLVTNIPKDKLFELDRRMMDYTSCVMFACQEEMYFGVGHRLIDGNTTVEQLAKIPLKCKIVFDNDEHQCILGSFIKMCGEVLSPSAFDNLMHYVGKCKNKVILTHDLIDALNACGCGVLVKEDSILCNSSDAKSQIMDHAINEQPFLVAIKGKINSIGHCVGVVNNIIVDSTFKDGLELSRETLDAVLGETVTEILWCKTFYPPKDKLKSNTSIQTFEDLMHERSYDSTQYVLENTSYYPDEHRPLQCNIPFANCAGQQLLGTFTKLISEVLTSDAYAQLVSKVEVLKNASNVGIKTCASLLSELRLGHIQKKKNYPDSDRNAIKEWIIDFASSGRPFIVCFYNKKKRAEICIGILGTMIVESNLFGGIDLNDTNLDYVIGDGQIHIEWCRVFSPNKDKINEGLNITTMQQHEH